MRTLLLVEGILTGETFRWSGTASGARYRTCVGTQARLSLGADPAGHHLCIRTSSPAESAAMLCAVYTAIAASKGDGDPAVGAGAHPQRPLPPLPKRAKGPVLHRQLVATVGMSAARAARVADRYGTMGNLCLAVRDDAGKAASQITALVGSSVVAWRLVGDLGGPSAPPERPKRGRTGKRSTAAGPLV